MNLSYFNLKTLKQTFDTLMTNNIFKLHKNSITQEKLVNCFKRHNKQVSHNGISEVLLCSVVGHAVGFRKGK